MVVLKILGTALLTLLYTVSPIDVVPDVIPILGWGDDVAVIVWAWTTVNKLLAESSATTSAASPTDGTPPAA